MNVNAIKRLDDDLTDENAFDRLLDDLVNERPIGKIVDQPRTPLPSASHVVERLNDDLADENAFDRSLDIHSNEGVTSKIIDHPLSPLPSTSHASIAGSSAPQRIQDARAADESCTEKPCCNLATPGELVCAICRVKPRCAQCNRYLANSGLSDKQPICTACLNRKGGRRQALNGRVVEETLATSSADVDVNAFLGRQGDEIQRIVQSGIQEMISLKFYVTMETLLSRATELGRQTTNAYFHSPVLAIGDITDLDIDDLKKHLETALDNFTTMGSGWTLDCITSFTIHMIQYRPFVGSSYLPTPSPLQKKRAVLNIENRSDKQCFVWCILAALYPADNHPERVLKYKPFLDQIDCSGLKYPVTIPMIKKFVKVNKQISINIYKYVADGDAKFDVVPIYCTKQNRDKHIDLLLLHEGENSHYVLVRSMSRLISGRTFHGGKSYPCPHCCHAFTTDIAFSNHFLSCSKNLRQRIEFPKDDIVSFHAYKNAARCDFVIFCDFECYLRPCDVVDENSTHVVNTHEVSGFCIYTVSRNPEHASEPLYFSGENAMQMFFDFLIIEQQRIISILDRNLPMNDLSIEEKASYEAAYQCPYCEEEFTPTNLKVHHHDHTTGEFISHSCLRCNLQLKPTKRYKDDPQFLIPCIFHNLKNYDSHFIINQFDQRLTEKKDQTFGSVKIIAANMEKFIAFEINYLRFIDSVQFLSASLNTLVQNLAKAGKEKFIHTKKHMKNSELLYRKSVFPYEWFDDIKKLNETSLPPREAFYSRLNEECISDEDYLHAERMWKEFECETFKKFHDDYMKLDVLLLADVFEEFRTMCLENYKLDPAHYLTLPSFSWSAMLKMTKAKLRVITDPEAEAMIAGGIRGGISTINHRHAQGNNPYMSNYDSQKDTSYLVYLDCNNLYGASMSEKLPYDNFEFMRADKVENFDYMNVDVESDTGFILEVNLKYDEKLHESHNDYPLAPESINITADMLSPFCRKFGQKHLECKKLVPNLNDKEKYVVHIRNLQLYVNLGLRVTQIHRVLQFSQSAWLKPYIDFNTNKRKQAQNDFERDLFKLMNNSIFGKTMENVRKRRNIELVCDEKKCLKLAAKPQLENFRILNENTVLIERVKSVVLLDKPMYVGFSVLDLSKHLMFEFHYHFIKKQYGEKSVMCFSDTDSLLYHITDEQWFEKMDLSKFDTSNFDPSSVYYSKVNAKVLGKFKDECAGKSPVEFVGLRSKMYSLLVEQDQPSKHTAKGVKRGFVEKKVRHEMYLHTLQTRKCTYAKFLNFRSRSHVVETVNFSRICLSAYDDKRYVREDGIRTYAYGHYKLKQAFTDVNDM